VLRARRNAVRYAAVRHGLAPRASSPPFASKLFTVGVTGTNGKTTTTAWVAAALRALSKPVVRATTVGFFLDDEEVPIERSYDGFIDAALIRRA
jgi:UDP-N-acetylmuramyl tripeptide synthase